MTITNDFHNTTITIKAKHGQSVSKSTLRRVQRALCGMTDCICGRLDGSRNSRYGIEPAVAGDNEYYVALDRQETYGL